MIKQFFALLSVLLLLCSPLSAQETFNEQPSQPATYDDSGEQEQEPGQEKDDYDSDPEEEEEEEEEEEWQEKDYDDNGPAPGQERYAPQRGERPEGYPLRGDYSPDSYGYENRELHSEDEERKFQAFEKKLMDLGKDTSGLREMIDREDLSKEDLIERFGEREIAQAIDAAGAQREFGQLKDFRNSPDLYEDNRDYRYMPREEMMYGLLFRHIGENINPSELMKECSNPEVIVDKLMELLKSKVGDFTSVCSELSEEATQCEARVREGCSRIGQGPQWEEEGEEGIDELRKLEMRAYSCPPDANTIAEVCVLRSQQHRTERLDYLDEICAERWTYDQSRIQRDCQQQGQQKCDEDAYVSECVQNRWTPEREYDHPQEPRERPSPDSRRTPDEERPSSPQPIPPQETQPEPPHDGQTDTQQPSDSSESSERSGDSESSENQDSSESSSGSSDQESGSESSENTDSGSSDSGSSSSESSGTSDSGSSSGDGGSVTITGNVVREGREYAEQECRREFQEHVGPNCERMNSYCSKEGFVQSCIQNEKEAAGRFSSEAEIHCKIESKRQLQDVERQCKRMESEKTSCLQQSSRHCSELVESSGECKEKLQEDKVRALLLEEVKRRCAFAGDMEEKRDSDSYEVVLAVNRFATEEEIGEITALLEAPQRLLTLENTIVIKGIVKKDKVELLKTLSAVQRLKIDNLPEQEGSSAQAVKRVATKLATLRERDSQLPEELTYIVESEAADIAEVSDEFADFEEAESGKGIAYKMRRFFGLMKEAEEGEIMQLENNKKRLENSIESLKALAARIDEPVAKAVILEQVESLTAQQEAIGTLIAEKQKKAKGLVSLFTG